MASRKDSSEVPKENPPKNRLSMQTLSRMVTSLVSSQDQPEDTKSLTDGATKRDSSGTGAAPPPRPASLGAQRAGLMSGLPFRRETKYETVGDGLRKIYLEKVKPLEENSLFNEFHSARMETADFDSVPMILVIGQYSTGKSTFIKNLIGEEYPGIHIGPEPTTDKFVAVMEGPEYRITQGNAVIHDAKLPFRSLERFGNNFLSRFAAATMPSARLRGFCLIDSPGVLSGKKQTEDRGYDYTKVLAWFASRVDRILLLFDAHKLDISEELRDVIRAISPFDEKLRIILNKSDTIETPKLIRVHGALMWNLGRVMENPEVARVYICSFWDKPLQNHGLKDIFNEDQESLLKDLKQLPQLSAMRKINDFSKRCRVVRMHAYILNRVIEKSPKKLSFYKREKVIKLIEDLDEIYSYIQGNFSDSSGDLPSINLYREKLRQLSWSRFKKTDTTRLDKLTTILDTELPRLVEMAQLIDTSDGLMPPPRSRRSQRFSVPSASEDLLSSQATGPFALVEEKGTPFKKSSAIEEHRWTDNYRQGDWLVAILNPEKFVEWIKTYQASSKTDDKISGQTAKEIFKESKLQESTLRKIWRMSDVSEDGMLDLVEFCIASFLIYLVVEEEQELPSKLEGCLSHELGYAYFEKEKSRLYPNILR